MDRVELIRDRLTMAFSPEDLKIIDDSPLHAGHAGAAGGGGHFSVHIVSGKFSGQNSISRHRMVYQAVDDLMPEHIHALSIRALTPDEHRMNTLP